MKHLVQLSIRVNPIGIYYKHYEKVSEGIQHNFATDEEEQNYWMEEMQRNFPDGMNIPDPYLPRMIKYYSDP